MSYDWATDGGPAKRPMNRFFVAELPAHDMRLLFFRVAAYRASHVFIPTLECMGEILRLPEQNQDCVIYNPIVLEWIASQERAPISVLKTGALPGKSKGLIVPTLVTSEFLAITLLRPEIDDGDVKFILPYERVLPWWPFGKMEGKKSEWRVGVYLRSFLNNRDRHIKATVDYLKEWDEQTQLIVQEITLEGMNEQSKEQTE